MKLNFINRQYDPLPGEAAMPPSLADLSNPDYVQPAAAEKTPDAPAAEEAKPEEIVEGVNADGTIMEGYTKADDGTVTKDVPVAETAKEQEDDKAFWADVNKLHGTELVVEYPEGVDSLSPEGVYHRDKVVAAQAVENFEAYLKKADPRSYAYMLHRQAGGDDDSFYAVKSYSLPEYSTFKDDTDLQVKLYKSSLLTKGLDDDTAQMAVDKAIKDGVLFSKADAAYKTAEMAHETELKAIEEAQQAAEQQYTTNVNALNQSLTTAVNEGKGMRFIIPDTDKNNFLQFVKQHVEYDGKEGKFLLVQKVGDNLTQQLESLYLLYKKGDLTGLIKAKALTENTNRLRRAVDKTKENKASGVDANAKTGFVALGSL